jgi:hypothetical protein
MKPEGAWWPLIRALRAYSENGGVSPSGSATWNTFNIFPISV